MADLEASDTPTAGTSPQLAGTGTTNTTNAAIVIGVRRAGSSARVDSAIESATRFHLWLTTESHQVPIENAALLVTSAPTADSVSSTRRSDILQAFASLTLGHTGFEPDGTSPRERLWVYASGIGFRESTGRITLLTADEDNRLGTGVDLTELAEQIKDSGVFREVIFVADISQDSKINGPIVDSVAAGPSRHLPPFVVYYFLTSFAKPSVASERRFIDFLLEGLTGNAQDRRGNVTSRSLFEYVRKQMNSIAPDELAVRMSSSDDEILLVVAVKLAPPLGQADLASQISDQPKSANSKILGGKFAYRRRATDDEACLNAKDYIAALASLFGGADPSEFCFALYGAWGRGKTYLMEGVAEKLSESPSNYKAIFFSAWKYPTSPEVWVHLYEEFAKVAYQGSWIKTLPTVVRTGIAKNGVGQLMWAYFLLAFATFPLLNAIQIGAHILAVLYPLVGIMSVVWLAGISVAIRRTNQRLSKTYLSATRHTEKLGLQATIGADLLALLKGWMPEAGFFGCGTIITFWSITAFLLVGTYVRLTDGKALQQWFATSLDKTYLISAPTPVIVGVVIALCAVAYTIARLLASTGSAPKRVLLIVDDLDRCDPKHLLSVMESIKLLIEDREISKRVQVAMLIEEDILGHAILDKFKMLFDSTIEGFPTPNHNANVVIRETCEKMFLAHLRLPQLATTEVQEIIERFSGRFKRLQQQASELRARREAASRKVRRQPSPTVREGYEKKEVQAGPMVRGELQGTRWVDDESKPLQRPATNEEITAQQREIDESARAARIELEQLDRQLATIDAATRPERATEDNANTDFDESVIFSDVEIDAIQSAFRATRMPYNLGPRTIRSLLFRYQLARLLLNRLGIRGWAPDDLTTLLVARSFAENTPTDTKPIIQSMSSSEKLRRVVEQIA